MAQRAKKRRGSVKKPVQASAQKPEVPAQEFVTFASTAELQRSLLLDHLNQRIDQLYVRLDSLASRVDSQQTRVETKIALIEAELRDLPRIIERGMRAALQEEADEK